MMKTLGLYFALSTAVTGFVIPKLATPPRTAHTRTRTPLSMVGAVIMETEDDARFILRQAKLCAYDPDCSVNDAEIMLREMLHVQSGCVTGTLVGHDLCEEQDEAADVVAHLRDILRKGAVRQQKQPQPKKKIVTMKPTDSMFPLIATEVSLGAMFLIVAIFWTTLDMTQHHNLTPNTWGEYWSAIQGGYLTKMLLFYFPNVNMML